MSRDRGRNDPPLPRLVFGVALLALGVIFWLDRIRSIDASDYLRWWPLALIALGLAHLPYRKWVMGTWWLLVGTYFLLPLLGISRVHLGQILGLWPLLISFAGYTLVTQALRRTDRSFSAVAVMGGNIQKIGSQRFKGGEVVVVMGGCEIDLSNARIESEAVIDVLSFWGGIELKVPRGCRVIANEVAVVLGGLENRTEPAPEGAPRLVIRGSAIMAGVEIRHAKESLG